MTIINDKKELPEFISVKICRDHFARIANKTQCQQCPSILNNFENLRLSAPVQHQMVDSAHIDETLQRIIANQHHVIERLETDLAKIEKDTSKLTMVMMGIDGSNGIRSRVLNLEAQLLIIQKWIWIASGMMIAVQSLLFLLPKVWK